MNGLSTALLVFTRSLAATVIALLLSPIIAPSIIIQLPDCLPVRLLENLSISAVSLVAALAGIDVRLASRKDVIDDGPRLAWLPAPVMRVWTSPVGRMRYVKTYDQPGRWMTDAQLQQLFQQLRQIAENSIGSVPTHRLFNEEICRQVFTNRIVAIVYDQSGPIGFTVMVYLPYDGDVIVHLGLTMMDRRARGQRLQSVLSFKALATQLINMCRISCVVTNIGASPAGVGSVCDYFFDCYPTYDDSNECKEHHLRIAAHILEHFRHEFGCSRNAQFDPATFVVRYSNAPEGGGTHEFIKVDGRAVSSHKNTLCNEFMAKRLDFAAGDELFQVASVNAIASISKYVVARCSK